MTARAITDKSFSDHKGCSKWIPASPTQPRRAKTRRSAGKAAASEGDCRPSGRRLSPSQSGTGTGKAGASPMRV